MVFVELSLFYASVDEIFLGLLSKVTKNIYESGA